MFLIYMQKRSASGALDFTQISGNKKLLGCIDMLADSRFVLILIYNCMGNAEYTLSLLPLK